MLTRMKFYIVTPTYNSLSWLRCCIRSVYDQVGDGVEVHHHVQDGVSEDGTQEWLSAWQAEHANEPGYTLTYESAADDGMYDALNKAWDKMPPDAEATAHLNSDEQYLPQALAGVQSVMEARPHVDIVLASMIVSDAEGEYHCHRRPMKPDKWLSITVCELLTCTTFYRASFFRRHQVCFDKRYRCIGDLVFFHAILQKKPVTRIEPGLVTSVFSLSGSNLAWTKVIEQDWKEYGKVISPFWFKIHGVSYRIVNAQRMLVDMFYPAPTSYSMYVGDNTERMTKVISRPTCKWRTCGVAANSNRESC